MNRSTKLVLMFAPLGLIFLGLIGLVGDMRHPIVSQDQCVVTATGENARSYRASGRFIYRQSSDAIHDVSLQCKRMGTLLINDVHLFITPIHQGQKAELSRKAYRFLPERWQINVGTGS